MLDTTLWDALLRREGSGIARQSKIAVVGAGGFLGSTISLLLANHGFDVVAYSRFLSRAKFFDRSAKLRVVRANPNEPHYAEKVIGREPDIIIFCVGLDPARAERSPSEAFRINVGLLAKLGLEVARRRPETRIFFLSTVSVYGKRNGRYERLGAPLPNDIHGFSHLTAENMLSMLKSEYGVNSSSIRLANCFGPRVTIAPGRADFLALNQFCRAAATTGKISVNSAGLEARDFVFSLDVARAIKDLVSRSGDGHWSQPVDFASGADLPILRAAQIVREVAEDVFKKPVSIEAPNLAKDYQMRQASSPHAASADIQPKEAGFRPSMSLRNGIEQTLKFYHSQRTYWRETCAL